MVSAAGYGSKIHGGPPVDFIGQCPEAVFRDILYYLTFTQMSLCCRVSRSWRDFAGDSALMKKSVYRDVAFAHRQWTYYFQEAGIEAQEDPNCMVRELEALAPNIGKILKSPCSIFRGKRIIETHELFCLSGRVTIRAMSGIAKTHFPRNFNGFKYISPELLNISYEPSGKECEWRAMTNKVVPGSRNLERFRTDDIMEEVSRKAGVLYAAPTTRQGVACLMIKYLHTCSLKKPQIPGIRLFSDDPLTFTRTGTSMYRYRYIVGNFSREGFTIDDNVSKYDHSIGVAGVRDVSAYGSLSDS